ncbi:hypothetical protein JCM15457_1911 [Liquorilactobacillus sucicola DSM 21376 = JCM 15457]|uniref:Uncharacterized protein n=1 Tax=Liquorilactobacillus sucicola DSM 21376 = JCM 15457 TaxID=1423806 RepID=A0A023CYJ5_9LACO|nr:heme-binding protein [Liquorilactobacillus sucicola]KRN06689.1 hypothetical protein FD15_GL000242 [Liquorilactobacillus sucicola DSM 21376 = JCM 15457]GAJ26957.1 hypothetical protein JCM15457_1911 [Liquorilactobacillus sucicola DSM 21376 = JCM 15457]
MKSTIEILDQELMATLKHFTLSDVPKLVDAIEKTSKEDYQRIVVEIYKGSRLVFLSAGSKTTFENNLWAKKKHNVVAQYEHSSLYEKAVYKADNKVFFESSGCSAADYAIVGGGFPINVTTVGFSGVLVISGLTDEEDHELAYTALTELKKTQ